MTVTVTDPDFKFWGARPRGRINTAFREADLFFSKKAREEIQHKPLKILSVGLGKRGPKHKEFAGSAVPGGGGVCEAGFLPKFFMFLLFFGSRFLRRFQEFPALTLWRGPS